MDIGSPHHTHRIFAVSIFCLKNMWPRHSKSFLIRSKKKRRPLHLTWCRSSFQGAFVTTSLRFENGWPFQVNDVLKVSSYVLMIIGDHTISTALIFEWLYHEKWRAAILFFSILIIFPWWWATTSFSQSSNCRSLFFNGKEGELQYHGFILLFDNWRGAL